MCGKGKTFIGKQGLYLKVQNTEQSLTRKMENTETVALFIVK